MAICCASSRFNLFYASLNSTFGLETDATESTDRPTESSCSKERNRIHNCISMMKLNFWTCSDEMCKGVQARKMRMRFASSLARSRSTESNFNSFAITKWMRNWKNRIVFYSLLVFFLRHLFVSVFRLFWMESRRWTQWRKPNSQKRCEQTKNFTTNVRCNSLQIFTLIRFRLNLKCIFICLCTSSLQTLLCAFHFEVIRLLWRFLIR